MGDPGALTVPRSETLGITESPETVLTGAKI